MKYQYNAGESDSYPERMGVERWFSSDVDDDGVFEVPEDHERFSEIQARLEELGHTPVDVPAEDTDPLEGVTEDDLVELNGNEIKSLASDFDDLDGRKSADELLESLILKVRDDA